jgi:hypothetical protein
VGIIRLIVDTAIHFFQKWGRDRISVQVMGNVVGVSLATVCRRLGTKEDLVCW